MKKLSIVISTGLILNLLVFSNLGIAYTDVPEDSENLKAIEHVTKLKIATGYDDDTFKPNNKVNRAEFVKMLVLAKEGTNFESEGEECFPDVKEDDWFAPYVCYSKQNEVINGYPDGTFQPANHITFVEVAKILVNTLSDKKNFPEGEHWYSGFVDYLVVNNYIPTSIKRPDQEVTRAETAEMIWRMMEEMKDLPSVEASTFKTQSQTVASNIDMDVVKETWLNWYNSERQALGLEPYIYNELLNDTALAWSETAKERGYIDHKRPGQTAYYDYNMIGDWFKDLGLEFNSSQGSTFTENIGWNYYKCSAADCTQSLISSIRTSFDFFMSEKGKASRPHYDSIVSSNFKEIGLGISIDESAKKYYLTVHYGTSVASNL